MAREMEPRRRDIEIDLDHTPVQELDQAMLIEAILAQRSGPAVPLAGPEWASQLRPPAIPGTVQDKYVKVGLPARVAAYAVLWVTWDWKRGAFVLLVLGLLTAIVVTR